MSDNSTPFTTLDKQITAWNTFLKSENKQIDHDEATIYAL
ncbi:hypothetical protein VCSRO102_0016 [Vibrio cholerae]|nr:hypothetical protein VCSRO102_0016 [Vibrio cholerae]